MYKAILVSLILGNGVFACASHDAALADPTPGTGKADVWDQFDMLEPYTLPVGSPLAVAVSASAMLVEPRSLRINADGRSQFARVKTLAQHGICRNQPFAEQPSVGDCSATLIAPDVIVTAGHCIETCEGVSVLFGMALTSELMDPFTLTLRRAEQRYACREILKHESLGEYSVDYAIIRLDRPVSIAQPVAITAGEPGPTRAIVMGHPLGLPLKLSYGTMTAAGAGPFIDHTADTLSGNSGGGLFNEAGALVGIHTNGAGVGKPRLDSTLRCKTITPCTTATCRANQAFAVQALMADLVAVGARVVAAE